jgi:hypothetical protein
MSNCKKNGQCFVKKVEEWLAFNKEYWKEWSVISEEVWR